MSEDDAPQRLHRTRLVPARRPRPDNAAANPQRADESYLQFGLEMFHSGNLSAAAAAFQQATRHQPQRADAWDYLGQTLLGLHQLEEAEDACRQALALQPDRVETYLTLGVTLQQQERLVEAEESFRRVIAACPEHAGAHTNLGRLLLMQENYAEGWREYEWRLRTIPQLTARVVKPRWNGDPMPGQTLLVTTEQGLGDTLQFVRFLARAKERSEATVVLECQPELCRLLRSVAGIDAIAARPIDLSAPIVAHDAFIELMSLPFLLEVESLGDTPYLTADAQMHVLSADYADFRRSTDTPYLMADAEMQAGWEPRIGREPGALNVGIVWGGNPAQSDDSTRSCGLTAFEPLFSLPGVRWFSLQKGPAATQLARFPLAGMIHDLGRDCEDFADTAAAMSCLDLVITTCTAPAHLAGALGVPVWIALEYAADWRWLRDRKDSPWYASARLIRQPKPGDWASVFAEIVALLPDYQRLRNGGS